MAIVDYWLGDAGETTATVVIRSDTTGTMTITGVTASPVSVDTSIEYGIGKLSVTGLSADTSYPFVLYLDDVQVATGTLRTMPTSGQSWSFGFGSCLGRMRTQVYGYQYVNTHDIRAWFALGDTPYCDEGMPEINSTTGYTRWQASGAIPQTYTDWATGRSVWDATYLNLQRTPGWEYLTQRVPTYRMPDDHEYGNDWDWTTTNATGFTALTTQAQVDTCGGYANAAAASWNKGNPSNDDAEIGDWKPSSCADAAGNHPTRYYRKTVGNVEFFHIDCFGHMDAAAKSDAYKTVCINNATWNTALGYTYSNPSVAALAKTMLGPNQLNWLLTHLASSTATFKVILSGKHTFRALATSDNRGWNTYPTERDYILAFIKKYVTGVLWCTGDVHTASVINDISGHCAVNSSPLGQATWIDGSGTINYPNGYSENMIWRSNGHNSDIGRGMQPNSYGVVEVYPNYLVSKIYAANGTLLRTDYLLEGKNSLLPTKTIPIDKVF